MGRSGGRRDVLNLDGGGGGRRDGRGGGEEVEIHRSNGGVERGGGGGCSREGGRRGRDGWRRSRRAKRLLLLLLHLERLLVGVVRVGVGAKIHAVLRREHLHGLSLSSVRLRLRLRSTWEVAAVGEAHGEAGHAGHSLHPERADGVARLRLSVELLLLSDELGEVERLLTGVAGVDGEPVTVVGRHVAAVTRQQRRLLSLLVHQAVDGVNTSRGSVNGDRLGVLVRRVVLLGVDLLMLLEILRALEGLGADLRRGSREESALGDDGDGEDSYSRSRCGA